MTGHDGPLVLEASNAQTAVYDEHDCTYEHEQVDALGTTATLVVWGHFSKFSIIYD